MSTIDVQNAIRELTKKEITISDDQLIKQREKYDYLRGLNKEQLIAATARKGNFLVIAGPGTGKTHTLAYRVVHLVKTGVDPKSLVVITFTRKAGNELKYRINKLLPNTALGFVGTFHGFSNHVSTMIGNASPISKFRLLDQEDDVQVHRLVMAEFGDFNKKIRAQRLQKIMSYCYNTKLTIEDYINTFDYQELKGDLQNLVIYKDSYEKYKANHMLANYDDMILLISNYLEKNSEHKLTAFYEYLMVDEYQDTNKMQLDFIKHLKIPNLMVIGDDFQGIYAFRGADHRIILNFYNDFDQPRMIKLVKNYRSTGDIINKINDTVKKSSLGYQKSLELANSNEGESRVVSGESLEQHKTFILEKIKKHSNETHALIYRFNKNRAVFEKALIKEDIEYSVYGGIRLLERKHIKDVLAFLMVYLNKLDVVSFNRILTLLPGIGIKTASRLIRNRLGDLGKISGSKRLHLEGVKAIMNLECDKETLYQEICNFYFEIYEHVESEFYTKDEIQEDFKLVKELLVTYDSLHNFIINLILDPIVDMHKGKNPKVVLTTIHSAKGLEFDYVYYFHTHDWYKNYDIEALEEDRRLFYVGISRAKKNLYVFDHTDYKRSFADILRDFENGQGQLVEEDELTYTVINESQTLENLEKLSAAYDALAIEDEITYENVEAVESEVVESEDESPSSEEKPNIASRLSDFKDLFKK